MNSLNGATGSGGAAGGGNDNNNQQRGTVNSGRSSPAQANSDNGPGNGVPIAGVQAQAGGSITSPGNPGPGDDSQPSTSSQGATGPASPLSPSARRRDGGTEKTRLKKGFQRPPGRTKPPVPLPPITMPAADWARVIDKSLKEHQQATDTIRIYHLLYREGALAHVSTHPDGHIRLHFMHGSNTDGYIEVDHTGAIVNRSEPGEHVFIEVANAQAMSDFRQAVFAGDQFLTLGEFRAAARQHAGVQVHTGTPGVGTEIHHVRTALRRDGIAVVTDIETSGWCTRSANYATSRLDVAAITQASHVRGRTELTDSQPAPPGPPPSQRGVPWWATEQPGSSGSKPKKALGKGAEPPKPLKPGERPKPPKPLKPSDISGPTGFKHLSWSPEMLAAMGEGVTGTGPATGPGTGAAGTGPATGPGAGATTPGAGATGPGADATTPGADATGTGAGATGPGTTGPGPAPGPVGPPGPGTPPPPVPPKPKPAARPKATLVAGKAVLAPIPKPKGSAASTPPPPSPGPKPQLPSAADKKPVPAPRRGAADAAARVRPPSPPVPPPDDDGHSLPDFDREEMLQTATRFRPKPPMFQRPGHRKPFSRRPDQTTPPDQTAPPDQTTPPVKPPRQPK